jgi:hypothetical protein
MGLERRTGLDVLRRLGGQTFEQQGDDGFGLLRCGDFGAGREDAEGRIDDDLFYCLVLGWGFDTGAVAGVGGGLAAGVGLGQVEAGDLQAVEEETGAAGVDVVGGDALEDLADGGLNGGAVFGQGQVEGGAAAAALAGILDGSAGGVVVVTKFFAAEAWAGAAVAVGEDVAALVVRGGGRCGVLHGVVPYPVKVCKVFKRKDLRPDFRGRSFG